jgi:EAL domain-containing protein (putative c-di-GMP-specific phosphodiesterase class I)
MTNSYAAHDTVEVIAAPVRDRRPAQMRGSLVSHLLIVGAIAFVACALMIALQVEGGLDPVIARGLGAALFIAAIVGHIAGSRIPAPQPVRQRVRKRPVATAGEVAAELAAERVAVSLGAAASDDAALIMAQTVASAPEAPHAVEPSDLALLLLHEAQVGSQGAIALEPDVQPGTPQPETAGWAQRLASHFPQSTTQAASPPQPPLSQMRPVDTQVETEGERVDRLIKRLASDINRAEAALFQAPAAYVVPEQLALFPSPDELARLRDPAPALQSAPPPVPLAKLTELSNLDWRPATPQLEHFPTEAAPGSANRMRQNIDLDRRSEAGGTERTLGEQRPPEDRQRAAILSALEAQRIDVYLQPILDLAGQKPQHYEVSIALRNPLGQPIDLASATQGYGGTGLMPLIDTARVSRAAQMARRLAERGKGGAVITELSSFALEDQGFEMSALGNGASGAFPGQIVLALTQASVRTFTAADWQTMQRLWSAGFAFAITEITDLDMDFDALASGGFVFARLDAETFLTGLPIPGGVVPPADITGHLSRCGLTLIVGGILKDDQLAQIFGFGVLFGQGSLFGAPRPVKAEATAPPAIAAA